MMQAGTENLPIFRDAYCLAQQVFLHTAKFSRDFKFTLGESLNTDLIRLCTLILAINRQTDKLAALEEFLLLFDKITIELRLCADFHLLSYKQQAFLGQRLDSIKRQAIAWQKSERKKKKESSITSESRQDSELS